MTMSARASSSRRSSKGAARPPSAAASCSAFSKRPAAEDRRPRARLRTICLAATSLILPAPTSRTERSRSSPKIFRASSTATCETETALRPIAVSVRARFAAAIERLRSAFSTEPRLPAFSAAS